MAKRSANRFLFDQLDRAIQAMLARSSGQDVGPSEDFDPSVPALLGIARDLRDLPRDDFKVRLKTKLERSSEMENAAKQAISTKAAKQAETVPSGFHTIAPYIIVPRAGEFIEFLKKAFDGTERFRVGREPGSQFIMHAEVTVGNSNIELADANEQIPAAPQTIHLYVDDADAVFAQAIKAGATSIYEVGDHVSGDRQGAVRDPFGNIWYVSMKQGWTPGPEGVPSIQPYLHLRGSEKMIPFLENAFGGVVTGHVPRSPEGHVLHATVQIGDNTLELDEAHGEFQPMPCHLHLHIDDADAMYARAIRAGATSIDVPSNKPYGRSGGVKDPFGNSWYVTSPLQQKP
jgi:PhnB protein